MKILIIDNSATARHFIKKELEKIPNITFIEAGNGREGLAKTIEEHPDVITTSLMLQDTNAVEITAQIRQNPQISHIPVIIITASPDEALIRKAFQNGAAELFPKPFEPGKLKQYIEELYNKDLKFEDLNILVADDSGIMRSLIRGILSLQGANVIECADGQQAIEILNSEQRVDLVLTDYIMPHKDGLALCKYIRRQLQRSELPILILTSIGEPAVVLEALRAGANDYLTKPFSRDELLARIKNHAQLIHYHRQLKVELQHRQQREQAIQEELRQARETQQIILPETLPHIPGVEICCKYQPMNEIGGDFFNVFELAPERYGIMVADVSGHGVPAALISFMVSTVFASSTKNGETTLQTLQKTNEALHNRLQPGKFATMLYAIYDSQTRQLRFTNAGHPEGIVIRPQTQDVHLLSSRGLFIGPFDNDVADFEQKNFQLQSGDKVLFYTDAILEINDETETPLGKENLIEFIRLNRELPLQKLIEAIYRYGLKYGKMSHYADDITLIGMNIL